MPDAITNFRGAYAFLSNFYSDQNHNAIEFAYQAAKTNCPIYKNMILNAKTPGQAKRLGKEAPLVCNWDQIKNKVMYDLLKAKFKQGTQLAEWLLATGEMNLIEGNNWNDRYWGQCPIGTGENKLGKLLMQIRNELKDTNQ